MKVIELDRHRKAKIVVAAGDRNIAEALCEFFLTHEFKAELVNSFEQVFLSLSRKGVDMVLLTSFGFEAARIPPYIKEIRNMCPSVGIAVLSKDESIESEAMKTGADLFIPAPFCLRDLLGQIKTLLKVK